MVVTITDDDVIYLNGKITTFKELSKILSEKKNADNPILIKADRRARVGSVVNVWDLCRNLGIEKVNIATNQE